MANLKQNTECPNSDARGRTDEIVAKKLGIGGKNTYRREKFIVDNKDLLSLEDFCDWDEGRKGKENFPYLKSAGQFLSTIFLIQNFRFHLKR